MSDTVPPFISVPGFGPQKIPDGTEAVAVQGLTGTLTALHAEPTAPRRGAAVLIPGFTGSKEDFLPAIPFLADAGWEVLAYSQRGQADSDAPADADAYTLDGFAADAVTVARQLEDRAGTRPHLLGHSFGGRVARQAALDSPGSFRSLTLFASGSSAIPAMAQDGDAMRASLARAGGAAVFRAAYPQLNDEPQPDPLIEMVRQRAHRSSITSLLAIIGILASDDDRSTALAASGLPLHVIYGTDDLAWPTSVYAQDARTLGARSTALPGAGHSAQEEAPATFAAAVTDFWEHGS